MSTKDNFAQAMKELLNGESDSAVEKDVKKPSSFSSFSQPEAKPKAQESPKEEPKKEEKPSAYSSFSAPDLTAPEVPPAPEPIPAPAPTPAPAPAPAPAPSPAPAPEYRAPSASVFNAAPAPAPAAASFSPPIQPVAAMERPQATVAPGPMLTVPGLSPMNDDTTVIAPGTTIVGDMTISGGLRIGGSVKGNIKVASMMELNGKVIGDIEASDAVIVGSTVRGNITVTNVLTMDGETTVIGDVSAKNVDINGKIKGNLTVEERGHFQSNAVLVGNLMSGTVIIDEGAMLKGDISITSAQTENVTVEEPEFDIN